jgi:hypothetical protein
MKKTHVLIVLASIACLACMTSCKDEFHIPETTYIDSLAPVLNIITPVAEEIFIGKTKVPIKIQLSDDYELSSVTVRIDPTDLSLSSFTITQDMTGLQNYDFESTYTLPTADSMTYEVNITARDFVGNSPLPIQYTFTAK